jgi:two-component system chemotaxis sensor kinase CheA
MAALSDRDRELLLQTFLAESAENLGAMEHALIELESRPDDLETLHEIFRRAHSLKGDARMVGFQSVAEFAHAVEDTLERLREREAPVTAELVTRLLQAVDTLRGMIAAVTAGREPTRHGDAAVLSALGEALAAARDGAAAEPADAGVALAPAAAAAPAARTLRVEVGKLDRMLDLTGEIAIAGGRVERMLEALAGPAGRAALEAYRDLGRLQLELQEQVMKARLVPVGPFFRQFGRTVRDLARGAGKRVALVVEGEDVEVDTRVIEQLRDPLIHMIRNAVDHGIESPELRAALGKTPEGRLRLRAERAGSQIVIDVADDGGGLDRARIAERARALGLATEPERLDDTELLAFVFAPGFSTAAQVTELSGRGVGMDVVRRNVETLRGTITVASQAGAGTTFRLRLPLTLAIIQGFAVGCAGETYVLPLDAVVECLDLPAGSRGDDGVGVLNLRGTPLPWMRLRARFASGGARGAREQVVVVEQQGQRAGFVVDDLFGEHQTVIKPMGRLLGELPGIAGSSILGDGRVALILDVPALLRAACAA